MGTPTNTPSPSSIQPKPSTNPRCVRSGLSCLTAIVSGGQTGADLGGLHAASVLGLATGGWAPRGWLTSVGPQPQLGIRFGLREHTGGYGERTDANVRDSDATVRFALNFATAGELRTENAIHRYGKPSMGILFGIATGIDRGFVSLFREFLIEHQVHILNVAGNTEEHAPGIGAAVEAFLLRALGEDATAVVR